MKNTQSRGSALNYVLLVIVASMAVLTGCQREEEERAPVVRPVRILTIGGGGGGATLSYSGEIRAGETAELGFEVPGRIIELPVVEGQAVEKGEVLARLDPADFQAQLDQADANFRQAETTFERYRELVETGAVSRQDFDVRRRNLEVAEASLVTARKALNDTRLVAPFGGNVGRRLVDNFVNVQAKQGVLVLQDTTTLEVISAIPEQDWSRADPNMTNEERTERVNPRVSLSTLPGRSFPARVTEIANVADPVTRTFEVVVAMDNPADVTLLPGMTANITITVPDQDVSGALGEAYSIPKGAVVGDEQGNSTVWRVDPESMTVSRVQVELGELTGDQVRVSSGLNPGDRIATSGVHNLREGMQVSELRQ